MCLDIRGKGWYIYAMTIFKRRKWDRDPEYRFEIDDYAVKEDPSDPHKRVIVMVKTSQNELIHLHMTNGDCMQLLGKAQEALRVDIGLRMLPGFRWGGMF